MFWNQRVFIHCHEQIDLKQCRNDVQTVGYLKASRKTIAVAYQKSWRRSVENPPSTTTVAHVKASVPRPLPIFSTRATARTKRLSRFSAAAHGWSPLAGDGAGPELGAGIGAVTAAISVLRVWAKGELKVCASAWRASSDGDIITKTCKTLYDKGVYLILRVPRTILSVPLLSRNVSLFLPV